MSDLASRQNLDASRLLFDLKRGSELVNRFTGWLDADAIATCTTNGLIEIFDCAFARIWLVEADRQTLRLVSSAGLYTRLDGSFAQVPMGAFKVGKIAQHCIPFLSNALSEEDWVKDRNWAVENKIRGFAGLPLIADKQAIGVLAVFSHSAMAPELLEVLQILSLSVSGALASALNHQQIMRSQQFQAQPQKTPPVYLSEQLATILGPRKLSLTGVEHLLTPAINQVIVRIVEQLAQCPCQYCRLVYEDEDVVLEAILSANTAAIGMTALDAADQVLSFLSPQLRDLSSQVKCLGGTVQAQLDTDKTVAEVRWQIPQQLQGEHSVELAGFAGSRSGQSERAYGPAQDGSVRNEPIQHQSPLSDREQEVITLLAQGLRDREISEKLFISERTVKFHTKNLLGKLGVRTRTQAVFNAAKQGWL
ncbi:MAG: LuxR C-terminal-related transcriptional regulator [Cyanobacteria bacterium P01_D01_bin.1]